MITDLRFVEREEKVLFEHVTTGETTFEGRYEIVTKRILQAFVDDKWFDVPMVKE